MAVVAVVTFVAAYILIATERVLKMVTALAGAGVILAFGVVSSEEAFYRSCDGLEKQHRFACELLGIDDADALIATISNAGDARAQMIATTLVLGAYEADLGVDTWRNPNARTARYFSQITAWGYELSEIEQSVIKADSDGK